MELQNRNGGTEPFFSVVVPTYNREKFIERTLRSIQNQTFSDFEVIIVDDCSQDNTIDVIAPFLKDQRFQLIQNPENYERAKSRNRGMNLAKGNFLTLLDSDDLMYENCLLDAHQFATVNREFKFFRNYFEMVDEMGTVLKKFAQSVTENQIAKLAKENFISCIGVFTHREIYKNIFFDEDRRIIVSEDWEYWLRVRAAYKLGTIKKINCAFTQHPNRSMATFDAESIEKRKMLVIAKTLESEETRKVYGRYKKDMHVAALIFVAIQANIAGDPKTAIKYLRRACKISWVKCAQLRFFIALKNALQQLA